MIRVSDVEALLLTGFECLIALGNQGFPLRIDRSRRDWVVSPVFCP